MASHKPAYIVFLVFSWLAFVTLVIFTLFSDLDSRYFNTGLFRQSVFEFWRFKPTDLSPTEWVFAIWDVILLYNLIWLIYVTTTFARKDGEDEYVYTVGPFIHWLFYIFYVLAVGITIAAMFMYDQKNVIPAAILTAVASIFYTITLMIATIGTFRYYDEMVINGIPNEARLVLAFVQNGLGLMVGWLTIVATMILAVILTYEENLPGRTGSTIALVVFTVPYIAVSILDLGILERFGRLMFTPYIAVVYGLAGILANTGYNSDNPNSIFLVGDLTLASFLLLLKIILAIVREIRDPLFAESKDISEDNSSDEVSQAGSDVSRSSEISKSSQVSRASSERSEYSEKGENDYYND